MVWSGMTSHPSALFQPVAFRPTSGPPGGLGAKENVNCQQEELMREPAEPLNENIGGEDSGGPEARWEAGNSRNRKERNPRGRDNLEGCVEV